jgi:hypothetical protein
MSRLVLEGLVMFFAAFLGLMGAAVLVFFWAKKRLVMVQARLLTRVAAGDFSFRSLIAALRIRRHAVTIAMVRRQLLDDASRASVAVAEAERLGVADEHMGMRAAEITVAARELDEHMGRLGTVGIDPVLFARAGDLGIAAHQLRRDAQLRTTHATTADIPRPAVEGGRAARGPFRHPSQR